MEKEELANHRDMSPSSSRGQEAGYVNVNVHLICWNTNTTLATRTVAPYSTNTQTTILARLSPDRAHSARQNKVISKRMENQGSLNTSRAFPSFTRNTTRYTRLRNLLTHTAEPHQPQAAKLLSGKGGGCMKNRQKEKALIPKASATGRFAACQYTSSAAGILRHSSKAAYRIPFWS
jgi:hypothetical protein